MILLMMCYIVLQAMLYTLVAVTIHVFFTTGYLLLNLQETLLSVSQEDVVNA